MTKMTEIIKEKIKTLKKKAEKFDAEIDINTDKIIDENHLNCFWYGGHIGTIRYKGYECYITVCGDINISVYQSDNNAPVFEYINKNNTGAYSETAVLKYIEDDKALSELEAKELIGWKNNNWVELTVKNPENKYINLLDTVLDNNVLDAFDNVEYYIEIIERNRLKGIVKQLLNK